MLIVVLVPLLAALGFAGVNLTGALDKADQYRSTEQIAMTSRTGTSLITALAKERDLAVDPKAKDRLKGKGAEDKGHGDTDAQAGRFQQELAALPAEAGLERQRQVTAAALAALAKVRKLASSGGSSAEVEHDYAGVIVSVASLYNHVGGVGHKAWGAGWTLYTIALNNVMVTSQRSLLANAAQSGSLTAGQQGNILSAQVARDITGMEFGLYADPQEAAAFQRITNEEPAKNLTAAMQKLNASTGQISLAQTLPTTWYEDLTRISGKLAQLQEEVENRVLADAQRQKETAQEHVITGALIAALVLLLATALVVATSRHLVRRLNWLRRSASIVAEVHLPDVTRRLNKGSALPAALEGNILAPRTRDEIGDVARAFDRVYLEAVGLARQQAAMREEVNQLFQNLSRRNQVLVQRQLAVITELEDAEHSPEELSRLFHLDHLATQIRRNSENLLVLAGAEITAERHEATGLMALVRTAVSEIEEYQRVMCWALPPVDLVGYAADDLVHLIAELLDNAASFSSPDTWVVVSGGRMPNGRLMLQIRDSGIGMSSEQLAASERLLQQEAGNRTDLGQSLGLYVVGTLARKHGVTVRLYANSPSGVVASVVLPPSLVIERSPVTADPATRAGIARGQALHSPTDQHEQDEKDKKNREGPTLSLRPIGGAATHSAEQLAPYGNRPQAAPDVQATRAGLPIRQRRGLAGSLEAPRVPEQGQTTRPFPDPAEIRRRMAGLNNGIAGAEPPSAPQKEEQQS